MKGWGGVDMSCRDGEEQICHVGMGRREHTTAFPWTWQDDRS